MKYFVLLAFAIQAAALYMTAPPDMPVQSEARLIYTVTSDLQSPIPSTTLTSPSSITFSSLITIAPLSRNPLELRQRCFNDQGFRVDCAQWTGYYYTWGGAGHPYAGGPGEGGGADGGSRNNAITGIMGSANRIEGLKWPILMAVATLCLILML